MCFAESSAAEYAWTTIPTDDAELVIDDSPVVDAHPSRFREALENFSLLPAAVAGDLRLCPATDVLEELTEDRVTVLTEGVICVGG